MGKCEHNVMDGIILCNYWHSDFHLVEEKVGKKVKTKSEERLKKKQKKKKKICLKRENLESYLGCCYTRSGSDALVLSDGHLSMG